ncbi:MAG: hypothetical protein FWF29_09070, partial [Treponema sp.]|nr:hypothetical protein [Treponema sp.]
MAIETELKARIANPEKIRDKLSDLGIYRNRYTKKDAYWTFPENHNIRLRIRNEEKTIPGHEPIRNILVTCKTRELFGEMEANNERECTVSDSAIFEDILVQLG